ncbi:hypothetical protein NC653_010373 [Populus alba x Populus x berolinensis]|uniref:Uncharacterized protein n=1 Tax=Populus alba x Populus x berolinensis TaxID=444605 RepID=A0AAD6QZM5_9ROSI|nr:hypothetical protein NC653_010373 [Populus alba x Populus x berolinensis]
MHRFFNLQYDKKIRCSSTTEVPETFLIWLSPPLHSPTIFLQYAQLLIILMIWHRANVDFFLSPAQYDKKSRGFLAKKGMLAGLVLSIAAAVFFVIMFLFWLIKRKKTAKGRQLKFPFNIPTSLNGSLSGKEVGGSTTNHDTGKSQRLVPKKF